jgi:hypothetical protein
VAVTVFLSAAFPNRPDRLSDVVDAGLAALTADLTSYPSPIGNFLVRAPAVPSTAAFLSA